jgi:hypothetical protein
MDDYGFLNSAVGTTVTLRGVALNESLGAVIELSDASYVYVGGMKRWDRTVYGKTVEVTGVLADRALAPQAVINADGEASHGVIGTALVLDGARWKVEP